MSKTNGPKLDITTDVVCRQWLRELIPVREMSIQAQQCPSQNRHGVRRILGVGELSDSLQTRFETVKQRKVLVRRALANVLCLIVFAAFVDERGHAETFVSVAVGQV